VIIHFIAWVCIPVEADSIQCLRLILYHTYPYVSRVNNKYRVEQVCFKNIDPVECIRFLIDHPVHFYRSILCFIYISPDSKLKKLIGNVYPGRIKINLNASQGVEHFNIETVSSPYICIPGETICYFGAAIIISVVIMKALCKITCIIQL
jgi:hypothetical protein